MFGVKGMSKGYAQWKRRFRLVCGGLDVSALRCTFNIEKSVNETPNYSEIVVYNLAASTVSQVKAGQTVTLEAGYEEGNFGLIFTGQVVQPIVDREGGVDTRLRLICQDGDDYINNSFTAQTVEKGSTPADVVNTCSTIPQNVIGDKVQSGDAYIRGKTMFGPSSDYLKEVAQKTDTQFFVDDGKINIVGEEDYDKGAVVTLNADTGLVGDPSQTDDGVSAQCLINPAIKLNSLVHIDSSSIVAKAVQDAESTVSSFSANGCYKVVKLTYEGDNFGESWYCNFDAITQDGSQPAGVATAPAASTAKKEEKKQESPSSGSGSKSKGSGSDGPKQSVLSQLLDGTSWR